MNWPTAFLSFCMALTAFAVPASAADSESEPESERQRRFVFFSGVDISSISVFSWGGVDAPLFSPNRDVSGAIVRVMGGAGYYDYERIGAPDNRVMGTVSLGEVMAGWRHIGTAACITVLGGFAIEDHTLDVEDPTNPVQGTKSGAKVQAELFWRPTEKTQVDASVSYFTVHDSWRVRLAGGRTIWRGWVAGAEAEAFGNSESDQGRLGLFVSDIGWKRWSFKASAGVLHDREEFGAYGRLGTDMRF